MIKLGLNADNPYTYRKDARPDIIPAAWGNPEHLVNPVSLIGAINSGRYSKLPRLTGPKG